MERGKFRIVLATHGTLAKGLLDSLQMLLGEQPGIEAYCLEPHMKMETFAEVLKGEITQYGAENILFFSDLMNGTPFNALIFLTRECPVLYHITGVNLTTLIGAVVSRNRGAQSVQEMSDAAMAAADGSILDAKVLLEAIGEEDDE